MCTMVSTVGSSPAFVRGAAARMICPFVAVNRIGDPRFMLLKDGRTFVRAHRRVKNICFAMAPGQPRKAHMPAYPYQPIEYPRWRMLRRLSTRTVIRSGETCTVGRQFARLKGFHAIRYSGTDLPKGLVTNFLALC
ncbi:hypothetical protein P153DRAFT_353694 [Dothidotthia symphoricarpi CBS 119687]|uniref:Uncharacterized protein n=1 Tax=Dothidotthia symphoricarpi CBS 119687 TaxID=1392245 RepID=A0A6A6AR39_9PLEO|nr:uncharacterized protein P153DRAFT_353694 [Dothidotthia symphoricarpi CBS 119687]KAF2133307.1 hypothetical protein P153DRAFT_353694 [Dothidotthia symphoricarpi CBS 119687]